MNGIRGSFPQCVVLAAGYSARLGRNKALLRIHGVSLIRRTVRLLEGLSRKPVMVVIPPRAHRLRAELTHEAVIYLENPERARGLASSVRRALKSTRFMTPTVLLVPVDLVHLKRRDLERLVARARAHPRALVARRLHGGPATPLLLPAHLRPRALALEGDRGLGALFRESPPHGMELLDLHSAAADLDTPAQLRAARTLRALGAGRELRARHGRPAQVRGV